MDLLGLWGEYTQIKLILWGIHANVGNHYFFRMGYHILGQRERFMLLAYSMKALAGVSPSLCPSSSLQLPNHVHHEKLLFRIG